MNTRQYASLILHRAVMILKADSASYYLGTLWWVLEPLLYLSAFYIVFGLVMERGGPGYIGFLLAGLVFFRWFSATLVRAASSIFNNGRLINQIYLPKIVFPLVEICCGTLRFALVLALFLPFIWWYTGNITQAWWGLVPLMLAQLLFITGTSFILAFLIPLYPDFQRVVENVMMLLFYMSGVFFDISKAPEAIQQWLYLNPMAVMLEQYRGIFIDGQFPDLLALLPGLGFSLLCVVVGASLLVAYDRKFPYYVN